MRGLLAALRRKLRLIRCRGRIDFVPPEADEGSFTYYDGPSFVWTEAGFEESGKPTLCGDRPRTKPGNLPVSAPLVEEPPAEPSWCYCI